MNDGLGMEYTQYCPKCVEGYDNEGEYCSECGTKLLSIPKCKKCEYEFELFDRFCRRCGTETEFNKLATKRRRPLMLA
jgi:predicted amidophosphoribosyltransferase